MYPLKVSVTKTKLDALAAAIAEKSGAEVPLTLDEMTEEVYGISGGGGSVNLQTKSVSYTPTETAQSATVTADAGYDGLDEVSVNVGAISSTYVGTGVSRRDVSDMEQESEYVLAPAGYYADDTWFQTHLGTQGTPTATKGTVNNHSVTVTPSVTNGWGYISGGTQTGTAVTVSASELVSGSETKTQNGTYDVTNLAELVVNVAGGGVSGLEYETGTWTPESDIARGAISFSDTHSEAPVLIYLCDQTGTASSATNSNHIFMYADPFKLWGYGYPYGSSTFRYANVWCSYRGTSSTSLSTISIYITYNSNNTSSSNTSYARYWATNTEFYPYSNSTSRYWRAERTYKWIAVWKPTT